MTASHGRTQQCAVSFNDVDADEPLPYFNNRVGVLSLGLHLSHRTHIVDNSRGILEPIN